jgi:hypothetical protein
MKLHIIRRGEKCLGSLPLAAQISSNCYSAVTVLGYALWLILINCNPYTNLRNGSVQRNFGYEVAGEK